MQALPVVLFVVGIVGLVLGVMAARYARRQLRSAGRTYWRAQLVPLCVGAVVAALLTLCTYPVSASARIVGLPFPVAAFEKHGDVWMDFVGITSIPFFIANAAFWLLLPQLLVAWRLRRNRGTETR